MGKYMKANVQTVYSSTNLHSHCTINQESNPLVFHFIKRCPIAGVSSHWNRIWNPWTGGMITIYVVGSYKINPTRAECLVMPQIVPTAIKIWGTRYRLGCAREHTRFPNSISRPQFGGPSRRSILMAMNRESINQEIRKQPSSFN
jgi:hypothetical protein